MKNSQKIKLNHRLRRQIRTRSQLHGTADCPRLSIKRSLRYISAQAIDDDHSVTLVGLHENKLKLSGSRIERAEEFGKVLAGRLQAKGIKKIIFDRGAYKYHGRVKAVAEGLRQAGIQF